MLLSLRLEHHVWTLWRCTVTPTSPGRTHADFNQGSPQTVRVWRSYRSNLNHWITGKFKFVCYTQAVSAAFEQTWHPSDSRSIQNTAERDSSYYTELILQLWNSSRMWCTVATVKGAQGGPPVTPSARCAGVGFTCDENYHFRKYFIQTFDCDLWHMP